MLRKKETEPLSPPTSQPPGLNAYLDQGASIEGKMVFRGSVRIDGSFQGEIYSDDLLIVGETGAIEGKFQVGEAIIGGKVRGTLEVKRAVTFNPKANFSGELITPVLVVEAGAVLDGTIRMTAGPEEKRHLEHQVIQVLEERRS
jgi:cytoskeletal protein CcmA (bactofilin family)